MNQTHIANNVVLYLSGSGSIAVSIGTKLFGTQIMSKQTFSISGAAKWYQLFFSNISLSTGTNYFLNVNLVSGSTQWGYVSSPPVDVGATQDYWYSGSTLVNDNSYPDVYSIGYYAQQTSTSPSPSPSPNPTGVFVEVNATASTTGTGTTGIVCSCGKADVAEEQLIPLCCTRYAECLLGHYLGAKEFSSYGNRNGSRSG